MPDPAANKVTIAAFEGIKNLSKESSNTPQTLREAVNVDLDKEGKPSTRAGRTLVATCVQGGSLWGDPRVPFALFVDGGEIKALFPDLHTETIRSGIAVGLPVSYALLADRVLWSNRIQCGAIDMGLQASDWATQNPSGQPTLSTVANTGTIGQGTVQIAITFIDASGRESGSTLATMIEVDGTQAVMLADIPQPYDPSAVPTIAIYATAPGDAVLARVATIPAGVSTFLITEPPPGRPLRTQFLEPLPPGQLVAAFNGRQLVARGKHLLWSPSLRYGLFDRAENSTRFAADIDAIGPVGEGTTSSGVYVGAGERTYYLDGADPATWRQAIKYPYGIVAGTLVQTPAEHWGIESKELVPAWLAKNGLFCVGLSGGRVVSFKGGDAVAESGDSGASLFREINGIRQFLTALRAPMATGLRITDKATVITYNHESGT
ncbi:MAG: hypothetical protein JSS23_00130 [Proteobacteria bacterium]|nr:hypothetical protein [Pseudomonadota bacterium]